MKKIIVLGLILFITISVLNACTNDGDPITLDSIKTTLKDAGYTIIEDVGHSPENSVKGFSFAYFGAHGSVNVPIWEFKDKSSADDYAAYINTNKNLLAIVNDNFLTIGEAHHGVAHANEKTFLENLISGKDIK